MKKMSDQDGKSVNVVETQPETAIINTNPVSEKPKKRAKFDDESRKKKKEKKHKKDGGKRSKNTENSEKSVVDALTTTTTTQTKRKRKSGVYHPTRNGANETAPTDEKKRRMHPGTRALREIRFMQKTVTPVFPASTIKSIVGRCASEANPKDVRFKRRAFELFRVASEDFM